MRSTTHKTQSSYNFAFLLLRNPTANKKGQAKIKHIDDFVFLEKSYGQIIRLYISMQVAYLMHILKAVNYLQAYHQYSFESKSLSFS